jgi:hypothetical protein
MSNWDFKINHDGASGKDRCHVILDEDEVGRYLFEEGFHAVQSTLGNIEQRLVRQHSIEIDIRSQAKDREDLVEHLPML